MTRQKLAEMIESVYSFFLREVTNTTLNMWLYALEDVEDCDGEEAIKHWLKTAKRAAIPMPAEIIEIAEDVRTTRLFRMREIFVNNILTQLKETGCAVLNMPFPTCRYEPINLFSNERMMYWFLHETDCLRKGYQIYCYRDASENIRRLSVMPYGYKQPLKEAKRETVRRDQARAEELVNSLVKAVKVL
jgi:hypothetical protein